MERSSLIYKTPIGPLKLEATAEGICAVKWLFGKHSKSQADSAEKLSTTTKTQKEEDGVKASPATIVTGTKGAPRASSNAKADEHLQVCQAWLDAYFTGTLLQSNPPKPALVLPGSGALILFRQIMLLKLLNSSQPSIGTEFFHSVWSTLASTGVGETLSYKELAGLSGKPNAARAAGQAVKKHSLPILIPCHRVVKSGRGSSKCCTDAGEYSGGEGPATKEWLLEHEKKMLQRSQ